MGVKFQISLYAKNEESAKKAFSVAFDEIRRIDRIFSNYKSKSEAKRIMKGPSGQWQEISAPMAELLRLSEKLHKDTRENFDISLGLLTKEWRNARKEKVIPEENVIKKTLQSCGMNHFQVHVTKNLFKHDGAAVELDFGGIAKGYAADEALKKLKSIGVNRALVDASGDLTAGDPPPEESGWLVAVSKTDPSEGTTLKLRLANLSIATSGDAYQFLDSKKGRLSHLLNPKTGQPILGKRRCTVIAKSGALADALATAFSVAPNDQLCEIHRRFPKTAFERVVFLDGKTICQRSENWSKKIEPLVEEKK